MIKPIKELGQNFLRNENVIKKIISLLEIKDGDNIIEIGPGEGVITNEILKVNKDFKLTAIDVDPRVAEIMGEISSEKFNFVLGNVLKEKELFNKDEYKIVGAIPYNITSPIFHKIIEENNLAEKVILVVQKEVGIKVCDKNRGSYLSNYINYFYNTNYEATISKEDFYPIPKVDSAIIKFELRNFKKIEKEKFSNFLHKVFRSPRKKINKVFEIETLKKVNIDPNLRPENLSIDEILSLYNLENIQIEK